MLCIAQQLKQVMAARNAKILHQYGALPFLAADHGDIQVLLVTTRGRRDWIIPKGWPIPNLTAAATAEREAYEEAGLIGRIVGNAPCGSFRYEKQGSPMKGRICEVSVFLFAVERQLRKWPEKSERKTRWFAPEEASRLVASPGLAALLRADITGLIA